MDVKVELIFPFDLGLELDFSGPEAKDAAQEISSLSLPNLSFEGRVFTSARAETRLYRFGVGLVKLAFLADENPARCAEIACNIERISVGRTPLRDWLRSREGELIQEAEPYAAHRYDQRLREWEAFPVFIFDPAEVSDADAFIRKNYKAIYGIVSGEQNFDMLSDFVFQRDPLGNFGYYQDEVIISKRFGAVISSSESDKVLDLIALAYSQYWSLKSYHFVLDREIAAAQKLLEDLPPYYKFWQIPGRYQRFSTDAIDFGKDKLSIVDSLYNTSAGGSTVESDWHLRMVYNDMTKVFNVNELFRTLETKLDRVEESYNQAREFLSTNFFILLDIIFFLWLAWGVLDTALLLWIARK